MKILVIRLSSLGDIILTQPVVTKIRLMYPEAEVHFLTKPQFADIPAFFIHKNVDSQLTAQNFQVITYHKTPEFHRSLTDNGYDIVIDLQDKFSTWLIKLSTYNSKHITYKKQHRLRRDIVAHKTDKSISSTVELYFSIFEQLKGMRSESSADNNPVLHLSKADEPDLSAFISCDVRKEYIALFPGATHPTKMYPIPLFIRLIEQLPENVHVILLGSKAEAEICNIIHLVQPKRTVNLAGVFTLYQLIYLIDKVDYVISNDSGPMHIAAALSKPQIALYGSTHPRLGFAPLNKNAQVICKNLPCQPCSLHGHQVCPLKHYACMMSIHPEEIIATLDTLETA